MKLWIVAVALVISIVLVLFSIRYAPDSTAGTIAGQAYGASVAKAPRAAQVVAVTDDGSNIGTPDNNP